MSINQIDAPIPILDRLWDQQLAPSAMRLPLELQEAVIDQLSIDRRMLATASLVCKEWRVRTYHHIFFSIRLTPTSVHSFLELIHEPFSSSAILPKIRSLHLATSQICAWEAKEKDALRPILSHLSGLGNIVTLIMDKVKPDVISLLCGCFPKITGLHLISVRFDSPTNLVDFVFAYPHLRYTTLQDLDRPRVKEPFPSHNIPQLPTGSYSLSLRVHGNQAIQRTVRWTRPGSFSPLSRDEVDNLGAQVSIHNIGISSAINALGSSLHHFELISHIETKDVISEEMLHSVDLSKATSLTHLSIGSSMRVLLLLPWIPAILSKLPSSPSPTLKVLQIAFASSRQFNLDKPFLQCLSTIFSLPQFRALEIIHFAAFGSVVDDGMKNLVTQHVKEALPVWHRKNALRFSFPLFPM